MAEIAKCSKCGKPIDESHGNSWCTRCGEPLPDEIQNRLPKLVALHAAARAPYQEDTASSTGRIGSPIVNRYRDAYRVGAALVGFGDAIKVLGAIFAGCIIFLAMFNSGNRPFAGYAVMAGIFLGAMVGALFWLCGVIVAAQGQILRATLDTAVVHSPFLNDHERLDAMGLPRSIADRASATT